jgi:hypothetical protein
MQGTEIKIKTSFSGVETSIMPIGNTNIHTQNNVSFFLNIWVLFLFCEFNSVGNWIERKTIILERSLF